MQGFLRGDSSPVGLRDCSARLLCEGIGAGAAFATMAFLAVEGAGVGSREDIGTDELLYSLTTTVLGSEWRSHHNGPISDRYKCLLSLLFDVVCDLHRKLSLRKYRIY